MTPQEFRARKAARISDHALDTSRRIMAILADGTDDAHLLAAEVVARSAELEALMILLQPMPETMDGGLVVGAKAGGGNGNPA